MGEGCSHCREAGIWQFSLVPQRVAIPGYGRFENYWQIYVAIAVSGGFAMFWWVLINVPLLTEKSQVYRKNYFFEVVFFQKRLSDQNTTSFWVGSLPRLGSHPVVFSPSCALLLYIMSCLSICMFYVDCTAKIKYIKYTYFLFLRVGMFNTIWQFSFASSMAQGAKSVLLSFL